jgi:uroporphyrinogen-III decarboxylase
MDTPWERFKQAAHLGAPDPVPVALIVDSPWLPGYAGIDTNDTPCPHLLESLAEANFDVFNFSHETDIGEVKARIGHRVALMGNVPPLGVGVHGTPADVARWAQECLDKGAPGGGMILSFGGGVSPGTPPENIDALLKAARGQS